MYQIIEPLNNYFSKLCVFGSKAIVLIYGYYKQGCAVLPEGGSVIRMIIAVRNMHADLPSRLGNNHFITNPAEAVPQIRIH